MDMLGLFDQILNADVFGDGEGWHLGEMHVAPTNMPVVGSHYAYTHLDLTGPGIITVLETTSTTDVAIQVDGGQIYSTNDIDRSLGATLMIPFKNSAKVSMSSAPAFSINVRALMGEGKWSDMTPVVSYTNSHDANTVVDLQGVSGVLMQVAASAAKVESDSSGVVTYAHGTSGGNYNIGPWPFKNRLRVTTSEAVPSNIDLVIMLDD